MSSWVGSLLFHSHCFPFHGQFDAVGLDVDEFLLVEVADSLLEDFFADSEHCVYLVGG